MVKIKALLIVASLIITLNLFSQSNSTTQATNYADYPHWIEMMQDHSVNFYDVQEAFNAYWENREVTRSNGWKQFKR